MVSLFYVKSKISDECEINTSISCDNVYYNCGECGAEEKIDLSEWGDFITKNGIDGFGCQIFCEKCSKKRRKENAAHSVAAL